VLGQSQAEASHVAVITHHADEHFKFKAKLAQEV
jgi:hypothetical protein